MYFSTGGTFDRSMNRVCQHLEQYEVEMEGHARTQFLKVSLYPDIKLHKLSQYDLRQSFVTRLQVRLFRKR